MSPWFPGLFHGSLADIDSKKWRQKINPAAVGLPGKEEFCRIFAALKRKVVSAESWADQGIPIWKKGFKCIDFLQADAIFCIPKKGVGRW